MTETDETREVSRRQPPVVGRLPRLPPMPRYESRGLLGMGGQGVVFRVHDRQLGRDVALKTLGPERSGSERVAAFVAEAQATARLTHPNVIPVHDVGTLPDGRPYFTMSLVSGRHLGHVLEELAAAAPGSPLLAEWSLVRLVQVVQQACRALQCAHEHALAHADVKPENVMLGASGEVLLVDWGIASGAARLAQTYPDDGAAQSGPARRGREVRGTLPYMAPERLQGEDPGPASDLYSVGVVLYEILAGGRPFEEPGQAELAEAILSRDLVPPSRRALAPVPPELESLALRALSRDRTLRPASAREFDQELQAFLDGSRERQRRARLGAECRAAAERSLAWHAAVRARQAQVAERLARLEGEHSTWQPVALKRPLIEARRERDELLVDEQQAFLAAAGAYTDALAHVPDEADVRAALTDLFWERYVAAEEEGREALARTYRSLVERFHDGRRERELLGTGSLALEVSPPGAAVTLHPQVENDLVLADGPGQDLGPAPVRLASLAMGSYVLVVRAEGHEPARVPAGIGRCVNWRGRVTLPPAGALADGFVFIPGGTAIAGGDPEALNSWPRREVTVAPFAMARFPVTFGEYCAFLDDLPTEAEVERFLPRLETEGPLCHRPGPEAGYVPSHPADLDDPVEQACLRRFGAAASLRLPVMGVDRDSALAFCAWRSERGRARFRLPTSEEWEFVARGEDRRPFPWGWRFDAALCHVRDSFPSQARRAPVGMFESDRSVHGVCDLGGCIQELTATWFDEERGLVEVRGGTWAGPGLYSRGARRAAQSAHARHPSVGFRLVQEL